MTQSYELNLRDYFSVFLKRKWIIAFSVFVVVFATGIYTRFQPLMYKATTFIKIEQFEEEANSLFPRPYHYYQDILRDYEKQIVSGTVIEKAVKSSGLVGSAVPVDQVDDFVRFVSGSISASAIENTNMIRVEMVSEDPHQAALLVNRVTEIFKADNMRRKNQKLRDSVEFIQSQLDKVSEGLKSTESRLKELTLKGVGSAATQLTEKIAQLQSQRADLLSKFTELHPDVVKIDETVASLRNELQKLPKEEFEYSTLQRDNEINARLYTTLREKLQEAQIRASEKIDNLLIVSPAVAPRSPFSPNKARNYTIGLILGLIFGIAMGLLLEHLDTSIGRIEDLESITGVSVIGVIPYFAEKAQGGGEARLRRAMFKRAERKAKIERMQSQLITLQPKDSLFQEAFRILGANVQVIFGDNGKIRNRVILVTSSNPQEGKSIISSNLSIILTQMGYKTLLVDGDLRRSIIHKIFSIPAKEGGLTDVLSGKQSFESVRKTTTDLLLTEGGSQEILKHSWFDNLHLLTAGTTFPNSPYLLNTERMDLFLKDVRSKYDVVIIDAPPVLAVSDTSILIPRVDGVIFIYKAGITSRMALRRAKMQTEGTRSKGIIKGIVLNNVRPEVSTESYYYYYRKKYYTEEK